MAERECRSRKRLNSHSVVVIVHFRSWHPAISLPVDSIYLLIVKLSVVQYPKENPAPHKVQMEVQWRGPHGYLSAIDYPLLHFYGFMCAFYIALAVAWSVVCVKYWKDLLRIQFWIGMEFSRRK